MNENDRADDPRLLSLAASISAGTPIDWRAERRAIADPEQSAALDELQALERLSRLNEPTPMTWGPFAIADEIGHGAFGTVYRASDPNLQVDVALKVIRPPSPDAPIDTARALREARLLAQINHPHVVRVYRADQIGNEVGVSMELIKGHTLDDIVEREGPYGACEALVIGRDLCRALAAVHGAGLLHGDIKARNVMRAEGGRTVLMDFGGGKDLKREAHRPDSISGTPLYLAPEVFGGGAATKATDIYSLGVLIYFLATGTYPIEGASYIDIERQHRQQAPRRALRDVRPDLPDAFIQVVDRATAARPGERYASAGAFEAAIDRALRGVSDPVAPPFPWWRVAAAAALVIALGLVSTAIYRALYPAARESSGAEGLVAVGPAPDSRNAAPPAPSVDSYRIEAALRRVEDGADVPLQSGTRVAPGDQLALDVRSSVPTYLYLVNEDEQGASYLLFPLPGMSLTNPLPAGERHRLPGVQGGQQIYWQVTSPGGREHFLIFASPDPPSPAFVRMFASLPRPVAGQPVVMSHRLTKDTVAVLRGVGGLASTPVASDQRLRMTKEFGTPLSASEEVVRGIWVRQIALENPGPR